MYVLHADEHFTGLSGASTSPEMRTLRQCCDVRVRVGVRVHRYIGQNTYSWT